MKEPWKKTCNGKVIITLNDEKTTPTEVEVPVDLNWTNRTDKKCSAPKAIILVGVVLLLGLTIVTLFKIQNLVYSTSYINWRMQELESAVSDSNDDVKLIKYKLSLDEREEEIAAAKAARAEPLIASLGNSKNIEQLDSQDLKLSESQNRKLTSNSLTPEAEEPKDTKEAEVQKAIKASDKPAPTETTNNKESTELNDARDHPNPADPAEWIKPLVETFDIFGNQPIEDHFIQNVLMKLLVPENNFEVLEFNKMQEANNAAQQDADNQKIMLTPIIRKQQERQIKSLPPVIENMMKNLMPSAGNFKIFHFNERPDQMQQNNMEEEMVPKMAFPNMKIKQILPPIEGLVKSLLPPNNMKIFQFNDKVQEQNSEEDMPKITIQSIKLKLLPLPPQEDFGMRRDIPNNNMNNFEVIRLNEQPEPSQEVEAPKMQMQMPISSFNPFPFPLQDILMKTILPSSKNIEIVPLNEKAEDQHMMHQQPPQQQPQDIDMGMNQQEQKFSPLPMPIQDLVMKTLMPPPSQNAESHYNSDVQEQPNQEVEVHKIPVRTMKITPFPLPIPEALMKSMLPVSSYGEPINMNDSQEDMQQQQQQQMPPQPPQEQQEQQQPQQQQMPPQPQQEVPRPMVRSTKLNPVDAVWNMAPPPQYPNESVQN